MCSSIPVDIIAELKGWQTGIGSFFGLIAIIIGALFNAHLNRRRDDRLQAREALAVAVAIYGEILLLRGEVARLARTISNIELRGRGSGTIDIDQHFLEAHPISEPTLYKALAPKIGMLHPTLILPITEFYANFQDMKLSLPLLVENSERPYSYGPTAVLRPAVAAAKKINAALLQIESMASIADPAQEPDLGEAEHVIEMEELRFAD